METNPAVTIRLVIQVIFPSIPELMPAMVIPFHWGVLPQGAGPAYALTSNPCGEVVCNMPKTIEKLLIVERTTTLASWSTIF